MSLSTLISLEPIMRNLNPRDFLRNITLDDLLGSGWNTLVALPPFIAGGATALTINRLGHKVFGRNAFISLGIKAGSFVIGANVAFLVANSMNAALVPFSADKVLRLGMVCGVLAFPCASALGYFGRRSLCVIGAAGAAIGALVPEWQS